MKKNLTRDVIVLIKIRKVKIKRTMHVQSKLETRKKKGKKREERKKERKERKRREK